MSDLLRVNLEKTADGLLAQYPDRPEIIVSGRNRTEIKRNLKTIMAGYVEAFPETRGELSGGGTDFKIDFREI